MFSWPCPANKPHLSQSGLQRLCCVHAWLPTQYIQLLPGPQITEHDRYWHRQEGRPSPQDPSQEVFLAFGRVFSGVLRDGQSMHVLSAAYNPIHPHLQRQVLKVRSHLNRKQQACHIFVPVLQNEQSNTIESGSGNQAVLP